MTVIDNPSSSRNLRGKYPGSIVLDDRLHAQANAALLVDFQVMVLDVQCLADGAIREMVIWRLPEADSERLRGDHDE